MKAINCVEFLQKHHQESDEVTFTRAFAWCAFAWGGSVSEGGSWSVQDAACINVHESAFEVSMVSFWLGRGGGQA